jgi:hypothetical protein
MRLANADGFSRLLFIASGEYRIEMLIEFPRGIVGDVQYLVGDAPSYVLGRD